MPTAKQEATAENTHIHKWALQRNGASKCIASYGGHICIKILVTEDLHSRISEEWANYYELCRATKSSEDYIKAKGFFKMYGKYNNPADKKALMGVIDTSVEKRCKVNPDFEDRVGEAKYMFKEAEYLPRPELPDPLNERNVYVTQ